MLPPIYFIIPDVNAFISGGNIYNKALINGLINLNISVHWQDLATFQKTKIKTNGIYFFDTLYLSELREILSKKNQSESKFYLIVHHLESLYPPRGIAASTLFQEKEFPLLKNFDGFLTSSQFTANY